MHSRAGHAPGDLRPARPDAVGGGGERRSQANASGNAENAGEPVCGAGRRRPSPSPAARRRRAAHARSARAAAAGARLDRPAPPSTDARRAARTPASGPRPPARAEDGARKRSQGFAPANTRRRRRRPTAPPKRLSIIEDGKAKARSDRASRLSPASPPLRSRCEKPSGARSEPERKPAAAAAARRQDRAAAKPRSRSRKPSAEPRARSLRPKKTTARGQGRAASGEDLKSEPRRPAGVGARRSLCRPLAMALRRIRPAWASPVALGSASLYGVNIVSTRLAALRRRVGRHARVLSRAS